MKESTVSKERQLQQQSRAATTTATPEKMRRQRPIYVVVVESHQHVLEHIHDVLRRERLLQLDWSMLHFDSHPDLACPNPSIPARVCFFPRETFPSTTAPITTATTNTNTTTTTTSSSAQQPEEKNLYELLDSTSAGIAEWILPLVLAANLRQVHWVKPTKRLVGNNKDQHPLPPQQLPTGIYTYQVGAALQTQTQMPKNNGVAPTPRYTSVLDLPASATVKVDWPHPYYLEDDSVIGFGNATTDVDLKKETEEQLLFPQRFELQVSELSTENTVAGISKRDVDFLPGQQNHQSTTTMAVEEDIFNHNSSNSNSHPHLWALDICLDYFACQNPFLTDLEAMDPAFTKALLEAVYNTRFYNSNVMKVTPAMEQRLVKGPKAVVLNQYRRNLMQFRQWLVEQLGQEMQQQQQQSPHPTSINNGSWSEYYDDPKEGEAYLSKLLHAFRSACSIQNDNGKTLISMTEQALPNLTMPHTSSGGNSNTTSDGKPGGGAISMESIRPALQRVQNELEHRFRSSSQSHDSTPTKDDKKDLSVSPDDSSTTTPFIITMARSSDDGFTPKQVVEELQETLLQHMHDLYCGCQYRKDMAATAQSQQPCEAVSGCQFRIIFDYGAWEGSSFT